jgi:O-acetyl-ADP-ribose deacetylase (regulator of RNase III)
MRPTPRLRPSQGFSSDDDWKMAVQVLTGDIFRSKAQTLVNPVNCVGAMGKGIALEFRKRFPDMYGDYAARCAKKQVRLGRPYLYSRSDPPWILNFPTKGHWKSTSHLGDIVAGIEYLATQYRNWGINSLAVPALGCGEGKLNWRNLGATLVRLLGQMDIPIELYAPPTIPREKLSPTLSGTGS